MNKNLNQFKVFFSILLILSFSASNPTYSADHKLIDRLDKHPARGLKPIISTPAEAIFSGVTGKISTPIPVVISNPGTEALTIAKMTISGTHASAFALSNPQAMPFSIPAGGTATVNLVFKPSSTSALGVLNASLTIASNAGEAAAKINLYGLSTKGEQGSNEPPLDQIVKTLGYAINVGGTGLILSTGPQAIGDEVLVPLFQKAGAGPVTIKAVARYSPDDLLEFGFYTKADGKPVLSKLGTVALDQEQILNPAVTADTKTSFDPDEATFGFYTGATSYAKQNTFTEDQLNTGPLPHSSRIYPIKNRQGQPVANTYLITFEPASNGDYQDYVFLVSNIKPAATLNGEYGSLEAENAVLRNAKIASNEPGFQGTGFVDYVNNSGDYIEWTINKKTESGVKLKFRYANAKTDRPLKLEINGVVVAGKLSFPTTNSWSTWSSSTISTKLKQGINKIRLTAIGFSGPNIDNVSFQDEQPATFEAENAKVSFAKIDSAHTGFTGSGFVDYIKASGEYIEWSFSQPSAKNTQLQLRYANGGALSRSLKLEVNGATVSPGLNFPSTGSWTVWQKVAINANLIEGMNTIRLTSIGTSGPNIDQLTLSDPPVASAFMQKSAFGDKDDMITAQKSLQASVYPNPAALNARIVLNNQSKLPVSVQIIDAMGKNHKNLLFNDTGIAGYDFPVHDLPSGIYVMIVQQGNDKTSTRFIVQSK